MINIAICDDDVACTSAIETMLLEIAKEQGIRIDCDVFFDGATLLQSIQNGELYDLIYLDVEMQGMNGIDAVKEMRKKDLAVLIVYVTQYEKHWREVVNTEPFRFLSKPINRDDLQSSLTAAFKRIQKRAEYFSYKYNKSFRKLPLNEISYFESNSRVIHIHTVKGGNEDVFYEKMGNIEEQLQKSNGSFIRIHQSFLVNFACIKRMTFSDVTLMDGTVLQISEDRQKAVRRQFCQLAGLEAMQDGGF